MIECAPKSPLKAFVENISFRYFRPCSSLRWYQRLNCRLEKLGISLEVANTALPADRLEAQAMLRELLHIPRMSTYAVAAIIDKAVSEMPAGAAFINVGVWHGFSFLAGMMCNPEQRCVAIDTFSEFGGPKDEFLSQFNARHTRNHEFYEMDFEEYFARFHSGPIGFYLYDAEHSYRSQLRGLEVAEPFFGEGCVIQVDDTNDDAPRKATLDFINRSPGKYQLLFDHRTAGNCHPTFWNGVMIFTRS